jgi:lysophospholipid acyltransferase (LPLAT)-like uncharacterized protein
MMGGSRYVLGGAAGAALLGGLLRTTRLTVINGESLAAAERSAGAAVVALWHGDLLAPTYAYRNRDYATMASRSGDGEYIARMLHHWGYRVARGSSSRGGDAALRELTRLVRQGHTAALTADGPRGPRHRLKHGVLRLAQLTGAPVVPVASAADRAWRLKSWDRFTLPRPFSRVCVVFGAAVPIPRDSTPASIEADAARLEDMLAELGRAAEAAVRDADGTPS